MEPVHGSIYEVEGGRRRSNIYMEQLCNPWAKVAPWHIYSSCDFISSDLIERQCCYILNSLYYT